MIYCLYQRLNLIFPKKNCSSACYVCMYVWKKYQTGFCNSFYKFFNFYFFCSPETTFTLGLYTYDIFSNRVVLFLQKTSVLLMEFLTCKLLQPSLSQYSKYPCGICTQDIAKNYNAVCCDICNLWVHIKCNNITKFCYRKLQNSHNPWYCKKCIKQILLFFRAYSKSPKQGYKRKFNILSKENNSRK